MKARKILIAIVALAVAGVTLSWGIKTWRAGVLARQEQRAFETASRLVGKGEFENGLAVIQAQVDTANRLNWKELEIHALTGLRAMPKLAAIYRHDPARILGNEEACIILARAYMSSRDKTGYAKIREVWRGHETRKDNWLVLDSDAQLVAGKALEAEKTLRSQKFTGPAEAARLVRLSLLLAQKDLPQAWQLLEDANRIDPRNTEIRSFRGQVLEASGKMGAAQVEYTAALAADTKDALLRDQLAEFHRRQGNLDFAQRIWEESIKDPTFDFVWLKAAFWQRMLRPGTMDAGKSAEGSLQPLVRWVATLPPGRFFDTNSFGKLPLATTFEQNRQELFWLQLAEALKNHRETEATQLLQINRFNANSWQPELETALLRILSFRQKQSLNPGSLNRPQAANTNRHEFFSQLSRLATEQKTNSRLEVPLEVANLLRGPDAFAAAFLAAGWREAALNLCQPNTCPTNEPAWFSYGLAQALRENRTPTAAYEFLSRQNQNPELQLLTAEMLIADGRAGDGYQRLVPLAGLKSAIGFRASCLLTLASLDAKKFEDARGWIKGNSQFAGEVTGQELLARVELGSGHTNAAEAIYHAIANTSVEAKVYLGRQAFDQHDWHEARRITTELVRELPENLQFRQNLLAIDRAEAGK